MSDHYNFEKVQHSHKETNYVSPRTMTKSSLAGLTQPSFLDKFSQDRKEKIQDSIFGITNTNDYRSTSPMKKSNVEILNQQQISEIGKLKKENLHFQLKIQELENLNIILEDQITAKNNQFFEKEHKLQQEMLSQKDDIESLMQKINQLQLENKEWQEGLQKFKQLKDHEIKQLKLNSEKDYEKDLKQIAQEFKQQSETEKIKYNKIKNSIENSNEQKDQKIQELQHECEQYNVKLKKLNNIIQQNENKLSQVQDTLDEKHKEICKNKKTYKDIQKKNQTQEETMITKLNEMTHAMDQNEEVIESQKAVIKKYQDELEKQKKIINQKEQLIDDLNHDLVKMNMNSNDMQVQIDEQFNQLQKEYNIQEDLQEKNIQLDDKLKIMGQQYRQMQENLQEKISELQETRQKNIKLEYEINAFELVEKRNSELDKKVQIMLTENGELKLHIKDLENQIKDLYSQATHSDNKYNSLNKIHQQLIDIQELKEQNSQTNFELTEQESQIDLLIAEIDRLNKLIKEEMDQNEELLNSNHDLQKFVPKLKEKEHENQLLEDEINSIMAKMQNMQKLQFRINDLENQCALHLQENENLQNNLTSRSKELSLSQYKFQEMESICYQLRQDMSAVGYLSQEIDRLMGVIKERDIELQNIKGVYSQFSDQNFTQDDKNRIKQHLCLMVLLFAEIEGLRNRLNLREQELVILRKQSLGTFLKKF